MTKSWKWECLDCGKWTTNALRFATKGEAEAYGWDLAGRWWSMPEPARAAKSNEPVSHAWKDGKLVDLDSGFEQKPPFRVSIG